jgi:hypothetical protein
MEDKLMNLKEHGMGRNPSPFDERDYKLENYIPSLKTLQTIMEEKVSRKWDFPRKPLDQEQTPHCVGFSMASFGINSPVNTMYTNEDGHNFYYLCKIEDGEPEQENGSSIRSAAKVLKNAERIDVYAFAFSMEAIKWWLINKGPMISGTIWTSGMMSPDENNIIRPTGIIVGGHAVLLNEWTEDNYIGIQNSWGDEWGENGKAYISADDFEILFKYDGEVMTTIELPLEIPEKKSFLERIIDLFTLLFRSIFGQENK